MFGHEVQHRLFLVEGSVALVHVENEAPVAGPSGGIHTRPHLGGIA